VVAISDQEISLAFWSAVVLHRFSMQQRNLAHLSPLLFVQDVNKYEARPFERKMTRRGKFLGARIAGACD
jgi:hypothetical protein